MWATFAAFFFNCPDNTWIILETVQTVWTNKRKRTHHDGHRVFATHSYIPQMTIMVQLSSVQFSWVRFSWVWFSLVELGLVQLSSVQLSSVQFSWVRFSSVEFSSVQLSLVWLIEFGLVKLCSVHLSSVQFSSVQQPETVVNMHGILHCISI